MDEDLALPIRPLAGSLHRIRSSSLAAGLLLLLCGMWSGLASAQAEPAPGTARVLVNGGDRPVEVPAPIQAPPRISAPSPLPFDRRPADATAASGTDSPVAAIERPGPSEPESRTPIRRAEGDAAVSTQRNATPVWLGVLIIAGTLAGVLVLIRFGRQLQPGPPELPSEALQQLGQQRLSPQLTLHLMQVGDRILLVGVGSDGARTLTEIDDPAEVQQIVGYCRSGQSAAATNSRKPLLPWTSKDRSPRPNTTASGGMLDRIDWRERAGMATVDRETSDG